MSETGSIILSGVHIGLLTSGADAILEEAYNVSADPRIGEEQISEVINI